MSKQNSELSDWSRKGFVEVDGRLVKVESLVDKRPVKKLPLYQEPPPTETPITKMLGLTLKPNTPGYFRLPDGINIWVRYLFNIVPCPAPRMTRRDAIFIDPNHSDPAKRQRVCVTRYFAFKREFMRQAEESGYKLTETLRVLFIMPFPKYWNKKKRETYLYQPHKQRPDCDNMCKAIMDASGVDDGYVWDIRAVKIWGEKGQIIIF